MKGMTLCNIAKACNGSLCLPEADRADFCTDQIEITCAVLDSRQIVEGGLFIATVGKRVDGHKFIPSVFEAGACCVITQKTPEQTQTEHGVPAAAWGPYILVQDSFQALKDIAEFYRSTLQIPVVGITGSVGKTSTKEFIAGVLSRKFKVLKTEGNFNNEVGLPLTILRIRDEHQAAVVEMGISDFGEMHRLSKIARPNICVITNIGQCHLENLKSRDGILKAKTEIFDFMEEDGEVCLNGGDDKLVTIQSVHGKQPHFFGLGENPAEEVYATDIISKGLFGSEAVLHIPQKENQNGFPVRVSLPGAHMVINAAAAACVAGLMGLNREEIAEGIAAVSPVGGRSNLIRLSAYTLIDDCYNANPVSMKAAIDLLNMADTGKTAILGDMYELGEKSDAMHAQVGEYAVQAGLDRIICIGKLSLAMFEAAKKAAMPGQSVVYFPSREDFLNALCQDRQNLLSEQDTILVKASHGMGFAQIVRKLSQET